jgi:hypothetical protein
MNGLGRRIGAAHDRRPRPAFQAERLPRHAIIALMMVLLLLNGCGAWSRTGGSHRLIDFSADLPAGWFRLKDVDYLLLTRDGPLLQSVTVSRLPAGGVLPHSLRTIAPGMLPLEAAEAVADDLRFDEAIGHFEVVESRPAVVGGLPGFRMTAVYRNMKDLRCKMVYYGVLRGPWFYGLRYDAPLRHYFDRDLAAFESIVGSFSFL